ncbi:hypothetical protein [Azospirillum soli]|uniref:hypothetical protein n=1 Tax=Azospirillum soli TaxID=1304799 RepID=UPI001AE2F25A|nr:hypothetical protein [Azospirillum soli]MBP2312993.1 hypothetical protein [Azospirillum soli]
MKDLRVKDIINIVTSDVPDGEKKLEKLFDWRYGREIEMVKFLFGAGISFLIALGVAVVKDGASITPAQIEGGLAATLVLFLFGLFRLFVLRRHNREYLSAIKLFSDIKRIQKFLIMYNKER